MEKRSDVSVSEAINNHRLITVCGTLAAVIIGAALLIFLPAGGSNARPTDLAYFSNDDGATWFADDAKKVAPFDKDGRPAYLAHVFTCDGGKTKFVLYLERYSTAAKKMIDGDRAKG